MHTCNVTQQEAERWDVEMEDTTFVVFFSLVAQTHTSSQGSQRGAVFSFHMSHCAMIANNEKRH
jgi:hypothetical protein